MRFLGMVKISAALLADFILLYMGAGVEAALILTAGILLYAWLGEYTSLLKDGAVRLNRLDDYEKGRLMRIKDCLVREVQHVSGRNISGLRFHVVPSDEMNAYAYGLNNVAVTRALLASCDDMTLCSVLGHEISHILNMDAVFHRVVFANVTLLMVCLTLSSFVSISFMWVLFAIFCGFGICGGLFSLLAFRGMSGVVKGIFTMLQYMVLFIYQTVMGLVSRSGEFRADKYSCHLGYGPQLSYFLTRFVEGQEPRKKTLNEILYASHPATYKRVQRIEQILRIE